MLISVVLENSVDRIDTVLVNGLWIANGELVDNKSTSMTGL